MKEFSQTNVERFILILMKKRLPINKIRKAIARAATNEFISAEDEEHELAIKFAKRLMDERHIYSMD